MDQGFLNALRRGTASCNTPSTQACHEFGGGGGAELVTCPAAKPNHLRSSLATVETAHLHEHTRSGLPLPPLPPASTPRKVKSPSLPGSCYKSLPCPQLRYRPAVYPRHVSLGGKQATQARGMWHSFSRHRVRKNFLCSALTSPSLSPQSNFLGNSAVAFPSLSPNKYHAKQDEYLLPRPSSMTHFLNQGRCNWALESWTPPKAERFCNNYSKKQKE